MKGKWKIERKPNAILRRYDVYGIGVTKKLEMKTSLEAHSSEEAERKGQRFSKAMMFQFSHVKVNGGLV